MSCASKKRCFIFTWEIENFDIFLRATKGRLSSPAWKTDTKKGEAVEWQVVAYHCGPSICFRLICLNNTWKPDRCESSAISSCGKMLSTYPKFSYFQSVKFAIHTKDMFVNKMQSNAPLNCLIVECKMWRNSMKGGGFRINSVVKRGIFSWDIEDPHFFSPSSSPYSHNKIVKEDNMRINMILDNEGVNNKYSICVLALPIIDGCFSFVCCKFRFYCIRAKETHESTDLKYNELRTEYRDEFIISKLSGGTVNASCKFKIALITNVAFHSNCRYQITQSTSSRIGITGGSYEAVYNPLSNDLLRLYRESILCDVTINTEGKSFSAHRSILAVRSPVFRAMFEKDEMIEGRSGVVDIDDVDSETVDRVLAFLYGYSLQGLQWKEAASLYYAADKYAVQPLKQMCTDILKAGLTVDNVCNAVVLADMHSDEQLKNNVADFIYDHQEVVSSSDWQQLEESNPRLVVKITKELFLKKVNK